MLPRFLATGQEFFLTRAAGMSKVKVKLIEIRNNH